MLFRRRFFAAQKRKARNPRRLRRLGGKRGGCVVIFTFVASYLLRFLGLFFSSCGRSFPENVNAPSAPFPKQTTGWPAKSRAFSFRSAPVPNDAIVEDRDCSGAPRRLHNHRRLTWLRFCCSFSAPRDEMAVETRQPFCVDCFCLFSRFGGCERKPRFCNLGDRQWFVDTCC